MLRGGIAEKNSDQPVYISTQCIRANPYYSLYLYTIDLILAVFKSIKYGRDMSEPDMRSPIHVFTFIF